MSVRILVGDVRERLRDLEPESVQCVVTSPPYFGLRSYSTEPQVWGGDADCAHEWIERRYYVEGGGGAQKSGEAFSEPGEANAQRIKDSRWRDDGLCVKCGAWMGHLGLEPTLAMFVDHLVAVFRDVRRVLHPTGCVFLNLGDSYNAQPGQRKTTDKAGPKQMTNGGSPGTPSRHDANLKPKDLMMVPARVAIALQDDGWYLRSDIIWAKKNCMPESVTDRPTSSHEHIFLLTKQSRYYWDAEAVRTEATSVTAKMPDGWDTGSGSHGTFHRNGREKGQRTDKQRGHRRRHDGFNDRWDAMSKDEQQAGGANIRNVWHLATEPFPEAHFATFPTEIPRRCIKAGTSERGQCSACGSPWRRVVEREGSEPVYVTGKNVHNGDRNDKGRTKFVGGKSETTGWQPSCTCDAGEPTPQTVLDPFAGSGTTLMVADQLGRHGVGIELSQEYATMAEQRVRNDAPMFAEVTTT